MEALIKEKLSKLKEYLGYLTTLKETPLETFTADFKALSLGLLSVFSFRVRIIIIPRPAG